MVIDLLTALVLVFVATRLVTAIRVSRRSRVRARMVELVKGLRPRHFLPAPLVLGVTGGAASLLVQVPGLDFGWWSAIGGYGNPVLGATERTAGTVLEYVVPIVFLILLVPALPLLVESEERAFRLGAELWSVPKRVQKAISFGLVHALIGIPIGIALALSVGGGYFTWCYLRAYRRGGRWWALAESCRAHLAYNATIVVLVLILLIAAAAFAL